MFSYLAGFYCTQFELEENRAAQRKSSFLVIAVLSLYVAFCIFILKKTSSMSDRRKTVVKLCIIILGIIISSASFLYVLGSSPHWCGNKG